MKSDLLAILIMLFSIIAFGVCVFEKQMLLMAFTFITFCLSAYIVTLKDKD
jgi:hypothetical protein